jgi:hypothetical protein
MEAVVLCWLASGAIACFVGGRRGLSAGAMFLCGLLLGPLGIVLAAVLQPSGEARGQALLRAGGVRCPECREAIRGDARRCPHCHTALDAAAMDSAWSEVRDRIEANEKAERRRVTTIIKIVVAALVACAAWAVLAMIVERP